MNASDYSFNDFRKVKSALKKLVGIQALRCLSHSLSLLYSTTLRLFELHNYVFLISMQLGFFLSDLLISCISDAWLEANGSIIVIFLTVILPLTCIFVQAEYINTELDLLKLAEEKYCWCRRMVYPLCICIFNTNDLFLSSVHAEFSAFSAFLLFKGPNPSWLGRYCLSKCWISFLAFQISKEILIDMTSVES